MFMLSGVITEIFSIITMIQRLRLEKLRYFNFSICKVVDFFENVYKTKFLTAFYLV